MPYADANAARMSTRERVRKHRARNKVAALPIEAPVGSDDVDALAEWSRRTLIIPPGHPLAGQPLIIPDYGVAFLRDALPVSEALLSIARKNAKSAIIAVYLLGRLAGPLRMNGYRAGVCSVNQGEGRQSCGFRWRPSSRRRASWTCVA